MTPETNIREIAAAFCQAAEHAREFARAAECVTALLLDGTAKGRSTNAPMPPRTHTCPRCHGRGKEPVRLLYERCRGCKGKGTLSPEPMPKKGRR